MLLFEALGADGETAVEKAVVLIEQMDKDHNSRLDFEEFAAGVKSDPFLQALVITGVEEMGLASDETSAARRIFAALDDNGNGYLEIGDLVRLHTLAGESDVKQARAMSRNVVASLTGEATLREPLTCDKFTDYIEREPSILEYLT